jgi:hypothetical protein
MKKVIFAVLMVLCFYVPQAQAYVVTATLTADNHYALYSGNATGSLLNFIGRNEYGTNGAPGQYNWSLPETFNFSTSDSYLYVVGWDDARTANSWIGQFSITGLGTVLSNTQDWESKVGTGVNPGEYGDLNLVTVTADIAAAGWSAPNVSTANGTAPWGTIPGISPQADFIWRDTFSSPNGNDGTYAIFRTDFLVTATPEPATMVLFGMGLAGLGVLRRRKLEA